MFVLSADVLLFGDGHFVQMQQSQAGRGGGAADIGGGFDPRRQVSACAERSLPTPGDDVAAAENGRSSAAGRDEGSQGDGDFESSYCAQRQAQANKCGGEGCGSLREVIGGGLEKRGCEGGAE